MARVINKLHMPELVKQRARISTIIAVEEHILDCRAQKERTASVLCRLTFNEFNTGIKDMYIAQLDCLSQ